MDMKHFLAVVLLAALTLSCAHENVMVSEQDPSLEQDGFSSDNFVSGEARVYLSEDMASMLEEAARCGDIMTKSPGMNRSIDELGIIEMKRLFPHAGEYEPRTRKEGLHRWYIVRYSSEIPVTRAQSSLEDIEGVEIFEPVRNIKINDFNDLSADLWGLYNQSNPGIDINVRPVWDNYTTGNSNVIVSVVDTGIDVNHEDLADNCLSTGHYNYVDNNQYITAGDHGTHVAGTIAAVSNNGKGVAGIAGGDKANGIPGVKLISSQILGNDGVGDPEASARAIKGAADKGAVISQNSWGYNFDKNGDGEIKGDEYTKAMNTRISASDKAAVDYFIKYAGCDNDGNQLPDSPMKGGVVIFAAGNDGIPNGAPAEYEKVIAVGSVDSDGTKSSFSNYGDWVDICAPGSGILSTTPDNSYGKMNGTSMACPHVSGVAALIVSRFGGPGFTNEMLKEKIIESSNRSIVSQTYKIGGLVDAYGAMVYGNDKAPAAVINLEVSGRGNNIDFTCTVPADEDGKAAYGFLALYGTDRQKVEEATVDNHASVKFSTFIHDKAVGEMATCTIKGLEFEKEYYIKVLAYSYGRNYSDATEVMTVATTSNNAPVVTTIYDGTTTIMPSETLNVPVEIIEPDGHSFTYNHIKGSEAETFTPTPDGKWRLTIKGIGADMGTYTAKIVAEDEYGLKGELEFTYTIRDNSAPVKIKDIDNVLLTSKGKEFTLDMGEYVSDPDGEQLKYDITISDPKVLHIVANGNQLLGTALGYGATDVQIVAKDARGESVTLTFKAQVKDPSTPVSIYPNPVKDFVNVSTLDAAETRILIVGQTGKKFYDKTSVVSGYEPARIDMTSCPPGVYSMTVTFGGKDYKQNVVKL